MTPTPLVLLLVALFWTLPATAAAIMYRRQDYSLTHLKASVQGRLSNLGSSLETPKAQLDAQ